MFVASSPGRALMAITLSLSVVASLQAQKQRKTELWLDSLPADTVSCGGLTIQFARFFKDYDEVKLLGANKKGTERNAIDIWISNRSDSSRGYDPHMFMALDQEGTQINFWNAEEIGTYMAGRGFLLKPETEAAQRSQQATSEANRRETSGRQEYASTRLLPGAAGGRKILVPDNDKKLDKGITLYCGEQNLGLLHKPK